MKKKDFRSGFVNIIGNPNVGKSTLMNKLIGERLSIITSKAQTTRHRILGIVNDENFQIVFSDTPGVIQPNYHLQTSMMKFVRSAFQDADLFLSMAEIGEKSLKNSSFFQQWVKHRYLLKQAYILKANLITRPLGYRNL